MLLRIRENTGIFSIASEFESLIDTLTFADHNFLIRDLELHETLELERKIRDVAGKRLTPEKSDTNEIGFVLLQMKVKFLIDHNQFRNREQIKNMHTIICQAILPDSQPCWRCN
jgi:hypothetical protein